MEYMSEDSELWSLCYSV